MRNPLLPVLLVALAAGPALAEPSVELPTVRWQRTPRLLSLHVEPAPGTHLAQLPLRARVTDGTHTVAERNGALPEVEGARASLRFPILKAEGWDVQLGGGVCSDGGDLCVPFHVSGRVERRGPPTGRWSPEPGRGPADVWESPQRPRRAPDRAPPEPEGAHLTWFDAAKPGGVEAAFADAERRGVAVLADFFAVWCPPCDLLRDEFLHAPHRQDLLATFTLLKLDADAPTAFAMKDRYRVGGYPTLLVIAPDGELLDRVEGWIGDVPLAERLADHARPASLETLQERFAAEPGLDAGLALSGRLAAVGRPAEAWDVLVEAAGEPSAGTPEVIAWAAELAAELERPDAVDLALLHADQPGPLGERVARVRAAADLMRGGKADAADAYLALRRPPLVAELWEATGAWVTWTADGAGADVSRVLGGGPTTQWSHVDAAYYLGTWPGLEGTPEARELLAIGASSALLGIFQREGRIPVGPAEMERTIALRPTIGAITPEQVAILRRNEGRFHDFVTLLTKAGLLDVAEDYLRRLVAAFPDAFTWHYRYAAFLRDHRSLEEALASADAAAAHAYGDNALRAARRRAELLIALERPDDASAVIAEALAAPEPPEQVRTHRYRKALVDLAATLPR